MIRRLTVWWDERAAGELTQDQHGELGFVYAPDWIADPPAHALSASLPSGVAGSPSGLICASEPSCPIRFRSNKPAALDELSHGI